MSSQAGKVICTSKTYLDERYSWRYCRELLLTLTVGAS